ncbi:MAG: HEPN domain-containing protein [Chloroflexota bacterium]
MNDDEHRAEVGHWLRYAREDLVAAQLLVTLSQATPREACWLAQQAAEKALKAGLVFLQTDFPKSHNLKPAAQSATPDLASDAGSPRPRAPDRLGDRGALSGSLVRGNGGRRFSCGCRGAGNRRVDRVRPAGLWLH